MRPSNDAVKSFETPVTAQHCDKGIISLRQQRAQKGEHVKDS
jgi:hypothetical protein